MKSVVIEERFRGPPRSANGGYICGLLAAHIDGDAEITLLAPPPLGMVPSPASSSGPHWTARPDLPVLVRSIWE